MTLWVMINTRTVQMKSQYIYGTTDIYMDIYDTCKVGKLCQCVNFAMTYTVIPNVVKPIDP